jgi:hypothetical protein
MKTNQAVLFATLLPVRMGLRRRGIPRWAIFLLPFLLLCACATQPKPPQVAHLPDNLPQQFEMDYMPSPLEGGHTEIVLEHGYLVRREYVAKYSGQSYRHVLAKTEYAVPTEAQWREFWREMERIRVWEWKNRYDPSDIGEEVYDGGGWHLKLAYRGRAVDTAGENSGPKPGNPKATTLDDDRLDVRLSEAISRLMKNGGG